MDVAPELDLPDEIDCDPGWVEAVARAMVVQVGDDWEDPALTPDTPRSRAEEFRESYRRAARQLLVALSNAGGLVTPDRLLRERAQALRDAADRMLGNNGAKLWLRMAADELDEPPVEPVAVKEASE